MSRKSKNLNFQLSTLNLAENRGVATIELLIAFAIIVLALSGVIVVVFGNQSIALDAELNNLALYKAEEKLERVFANVQSGATALPAAAATIDGIFTTDADVISYDCFWEVVGRARWWDSTTRPQDLLVPTKFVNIAASEALGHDCETGSDNGNGWDAPKPHESPDVIHPGSTAYDVDVVENGKGKFALIASGKTGVHETFWVVDVTDPTDEDNIVTVGEYDTGEALYGVDAYADGDIAYAFVASASSTAQLQVMEVDFSSYPGSNPTITRIAAEQLPGVGNSYPEGRSVYYYDNRVYVGTHETAGPEFHVFDVTNPGAPGHLGSVELFTNVHDIEVVGNMAYLATSDNDSELCVIDVSSPGSMSDCEDVSGMQYDSIGNFDGTTVDVVADRAYLGRKRAAGDHDFYVLDVGDLNNVSLLGSIDLGLNPTTQVVGVEVHGELAFIATSDQNPEPGPTGNGGPFMVYNVSDSLDIFLVSTCALNFSEKSTGMDFHDNTAYVTNVANDALRIIYPAPVCS